MSESFWSGILLAFAGGFLDAYTYVLRGGVFANAQTGNIVLLGISLAEGAVAQAVVYFLPIMAFVVGVFVTEMIRRRYQYSAYVHWRQIVIAIEAVTLFVIAFIPAGYLNTLVNVLISFVCAIQVESFRKLEGNTYTTTMCTGNLRSGTEQLFLYHRTRNREARQKSWQYYAIILFFMLGAVLSKLAMDGVGEKAVLFCCGILMVVFAMMFKKNV